jgi:hypothetical protein
LSQKKGVRRTANAFLASGGGRQQPVRLPAYQ